MALGIQIVGLAFACFMLYLSFLHFKRKEFTPKETFAWMLLWVVFIVLIFIPRVLQYLTDLLNISRVFDFFIVLGFMFLIGSSFYMYGLIRQTQKRIEHVVRKVALDEKDEDSVRR